MIEMSRPQPRTVLVVLVCVAACVAPLVLADLTFFMRMVLAAIVVTGLSLLMGYAGQASLGQGAFVAAGALTVAVGTTTLGAPAAGRAADARRWSRPRFAALVGVPLLRLHGHYLAFGTLALLLDGAGGDGHLRRARRCLRDQRHPAARVSATGSSSASCPTSTWRSAAWGWCWCSATGRCTAASGAASGPWPGARPQRSRPGVPVNRSKVTIFALSAGYAGLAGGLSAFFTPYVSPDSFPAVESFTYVIMAVVGGLGTIWGGVVGAVVVSVLLQVLNTVSSQPGLPPDGRRRSCSTRRTASCSSWLCSSCREASFPTVDGGVDRVLERRRVGVPG